MPAQSISNTFQVEIGGKPLPPEIDLAVVEVEDQLHLPDAFLLVLRDTARTALSAAGARIGSPVRISVLSDATTTPELLIAGEITAVEVELFAGTSSTVVRGFDQSHRLHRGRTTETYLNMTYADVAAKVAERHDMSGGTIDSTSPTWRHIAQPNEDDWTFLSRLGRECGREVAVSDGKLHFRKPVDAADAPGAKDLRSEDPLLLQAGSNLLELRGAVTAAEQVKEVEVRGWDPSRKEPVVQRAASATETVRNGSTSAQVAGIFPAPSLVAVGLPVADEKAAEAAAHAIAEQVGAGHTEMEGRARGNPLLRAGAAVRLHLLGEPFDGTYVLTSTRHGYDTDTGYTTSFTVSGRQERSLLALVGGAPDLSGPDRIDGVVPAVVEDVDDPDGDCRVRLRFPWLADRYVSDWSRLCLAGAGAERGLVVVPEVGDEVLVAFEQGDVRRPFVLGGLFNAKDRPPEAPVDLIDGSSKAINHRSFTSRTGHRLVFVDHDGDSAIEIRTGDGKLSIRLDQAGRKIAVSSAGDLEVEVDGDITVAAKGRIELRGKEVAIEAQTSWTGKGATVGLEGSGSVSVKGQPIQLN